MRADRPYQVRALRDLAAAFASGAKAPLLVSSTGSGKTVMMSEVASGHVRKGGTVAWVAHRRELLAQAAGTLRAFGLDVGVFGEGRAAPVQVRSVQSILAAGEVERCSMLILDEAHHHTAAEWSTVAATHKAAGAFLVGATATPERGDGIGLGHVFDALVVVAQPRELVALGALVPCELIRPKRRVPRGKLSISPLEAHVAYGRRKRNVVFASHVKAAEDFAAEFVAAGFAARVVHGKMRVETRDANLAAMRDGSCEVITSVGCLTEGWDLPAVENITLARDCGSTGMYLQIAGRGARPSPGKDSYRLIDLRGASFVHGKPDDDREYSLDGLGIGRGTGEAVIGIRLCKRCGSEVGEDAVCVGCGRDHALVAPEGAGIEMETWRAGRDAKMAREPDTERAKRLARWMVEADRRGYKPAQAMHRFRALYKQFPPASVRALAATLARQEKRDG